MDKKKLLFVDDEEHLCRIVKLNLERKEEYEVTTASSGQEGLERARETEFDLVITDLRMPGIDGEALLHALKAMRPQCRVVLCSVYYDNAEAITPEIRMKADRIIGKPIDHEQFYRTINEVLTQRADQKDPGVPGTTSPPPQTAGSLPPAARWGSQRVPRSVRTHA